MTNINEINYTTTMMKKQQIQRAAMFASKKMWALTAAIAFAGLPAMGQMIVNTTGTAYVEDFGAGKILYSGSNEAEANGRKIVIDGFATGSAIYVCESELDTINNTWVYHPVWNNNARFALDSRYVAASQWISWFAPPETAAPTNLTQPFVRNFNGDSDYQDVAQMEQNSILAINNGTLADLGSSTNYAVYLAKSRSVDTEITFRFLNNTGATVDSWQLSLDLWLDHISGRDTTFELMVGTSYTKWSSGLTVVDSVSSAGASDGWSSMGNLGDTVNMSVANGESLYVQMRQTRSGQAGNNDGFAFDNLSVTALIPEPSTLASVLGGFGLLAILRRYRVR